MPMVSIIVPVYNTKDYLKTCLESLINQTLTDIEIICVDDGSTDGSVFLLDEYAKKDERIKVIHKENGGVALARKIGIEAASGEYIGFVDSDDYVELDMYEELLNNMGEADIIMSGYISHIKDVVRKTFTNNIKSDFYSKENIEELYTNMMYSFEKDCITNIGYLWNKVFITEKMKSVINKINLSIKHYEDFYLVVCYLLESNSVSVIDKCFYHYIYREGSGSNEKNDNILFEYNQLYIELSEIIDTHIYKDILRKQLKKLFVAKVCTSFAQYYHFDKSIAPTRYIGNFKSLEGKRIVLYCAGKCGYDIYMQLKEFDYNIVLWIDENYQKHRELGLNVNSPNEIANIEFDIVYIAIENQDIAENIKNDLIKKGIESSKITYKIPKKIW